MDNDASPNEDIGLLGDMIAGIEVAMMVSTAPDGSLVSRPLSTRQIDFDGDLWFLVGAESGAMEEIAVDAHVNLAYADPDRHLYVSVAGAATIMRDPARIDALWSDDALAYFPGGKNDPTIRVLKVEVQSAQYWQRSGGLVGQALRLMRAVTGSGPEQIDDSGRLEIRA